MRALRTLDGLFRRIIPIARMRKSRALCLNTIGKVGYSLRHHLDWLPQVVLDTCRACVAIEQALRAHVPGAGVNLLRSE